MNTHDHGELQFKPNTTVATVVHANGKYLLVEELENGKTVYNQPAGHLEANENLIDACQRELSEETGIDIPPQYCSGIYYFHRADLKLYFLRFCFVIEIDKPIPCIPNDQDILACHWFTYQEIVERHQQLRSPMVLDCIDDYLAGHRIEIERLKSNL